MASLYDFLDPTKSDPLGHIRTDVEAQAGDAFGAATQALEESLSTGQLLAEAAARHGERILAEHGHRLKDLTDETRATMAAFGAAQGLGEAWRAYVRDAAERSILTLDALRRRGDVFLRHEAEGCPPVLVYEHEVVMDGRDLPYPSNYELLRILPPPGVTVDDAKRPFVIVDPRAGHGPGIGGFKTDSQVGVALKAGHPVYFLSFRRVPEPGQYLSYVTRSEAAFVREVERRHPHAPRPIVTGNCQGGWATLLLAATNPDLTGPIVVNGAPVAPWSGRVGENPMRYNAGVYGGAWIPMFLADLGGGLFDGAHLVQNFELLNPSRTLFRKYADLYRDIDKGVEKFLEFETWWGGYFLLNEPEIRWIVEQLFVGNRLVKNDAKLEPGRPVDLKAIRAPIIVFASHGDNITPPQQALNWIVETYADVDEIRIRGQRIVYMVHEQVGHLGIFVSGSVAKREHSEVASTLETIDALAPGLYEMQIEDYRGDVANRRFTVSFAERSFADIKRLDDDTDDEEQLFKAVSRVSEMQSQAYKATVRPVLRAAITPTMAEMGRAFHPQRASRALVSSRNPAMAPVARMAERVAETRAKAAPDNPFVKAEALWIDAMAQAIDFWRDQRDMMVELTFFAVWGTPWARMVGRAHAPNRTLKDKAELRVLPEVEEALAAIEEGGFAEAVIRMLVLLADSRHGVRRDRLERSNQVMTQDEPFRSLGAKRRGEIIHRQTVIARFEPERAVETLPKLLATSEQRALAVRVVSYVPGAVAEMAPETFALLRRYREVLGLPLEHVEVAEDPLAPSAAAE